MTVNLVVVGLGYVGMPLAQAAAVHGGLSVVGLDVNAEIVSGLSAGHSHIDDLSDDDISRMHASGFTATTDPSVVASAETVVVCVPTPLADGGPDLRAVTSAVRAIAEHLTAGTLVVLESTTYPGTTDEVVAPMLEEVSSLKAGADFHLAFSPERVDPGNRTYTLTNTPKVVGGYTQACAERAEAFYARFVDTVVVARGTREAETAKLLENTYRHINIALVNEMARFCHELDIDLWNVIEMARTKPFGFHAFYPGPGVGGHCIPIDPNYLSHRVRTRLGYPFRFVELAQEINATMPAYVARRAQDVLNLDGRAVRGSKVLLLGVTYKENISDERESPAVPLAAELRALGAEVYFHDPLVADWPAGGAGRVDDDLDSAVKAMDLVILVQNHAAYDLDQIIAAAPRFFDTRGATTSDRAFRL